MAAVMQAPPPRSRPAWETLLPADGDDDGGPGTAEHHLLVIEITEPGRFGLGFRDSALSRGGTTSIAFVEPDSPIAMCGVTTNHRLAKVNNEPVEGKTGKELMACISGLTRPTTLTFVDTTAASTYFGDVVFGFPATRPTYLQCFFAVSTGAVFSWSSRVKSVTNKQMRAAAIAELANSGMLCALLLTITTAPLISEAPTALPTGNLMAHTIYFGLWTVSTAALASALVSAIVLLVLISGLEDDQTPSFLQKIGVGLHISMALMLPSVVASVSGVTYLGWYTIYHSAFWSGCSVVFTCCCLFLWALLEMLRLYWDVLHTENSGRGKADHFTVL